MADAAIAVRGDLSKFNKDIQGAGKQADTLGGKMKSALSPKNLLAGAGIAVGLQQVTAFLGDSITAASDLNEVVSKTGEIIGQDMLPGMEEWAETASKSFGQSKRQALDGAATFAIFGKSAGLAGQDLAGFSTEMVELASDFASFHNASPEEAITAIGAALRGENEPIRRFGILLDDATLKARAMKMGLIETTSEALTPQIKVLAAQAEILEQSSDAQGDFARTSDGLANTQRTLAASMEDAQVELGEKLLPVMLEFTNFVIDYGVPAIEVLADALGEIGDGIGIVTDVLNTVSGAGAEINQFLTGTSREWDNLSQAQRDMVLESEASWQTYTDQTRSGTVYESEALQASQANWQAHQDIIADHATTTAKSLPQAVLDNWEAIKQAGEDAVTAYAQGLFENQDAINDEVEALLAHLDERLTPGEEISRLRGQKMQLMLARGIQAELGDAGAVAAIDDLIATINGQLAGLNGYNAGRNLVVTLANGIRQNLGTASLASAALAGVIRGPVFIESEPKDPNSPLRGITKIGGNIVQTIADGIYGALGAGTGASRALAGALMPSLGMPAFAGASVGGGSAGDTIININAPTTPMTERDIGRELRRTGAFGVNRG